MNKHAPTSGTARTLSLTRLDSYLPMVPVCVAPDDVGLIDHGDAFSTFLLFSPAEFECIFHLSVTKQ